MFDSSSLDSPYSGVDSGFGGSLSPRDKFERRGSCVAHYQLEVVNFKPAVDTQRQSETGQVEGRDQELRRSSEQKLQILLPLQFLKISLPCACLHGLEAQITV